MSTRCNIGILYPNGKLRGIYCHSDGYLSHTGEILLTQYSTAESVKKLIALGDISHLGTMGICPEKIDFSRYFADEEYYNSHKDYILSYHRDRGEKLYIGTFPSIQKFLSPENRQAYNYYFDEPKKEWFVEHNYTLMPLKDAIEKENAEIEYED